MASGRHLISSNKVRSSHSSTVTEHPLDMDCEDTGNEGAGKIKCFILKYSMRKLQWVMNMEICLAGRRRNVDPVCIQETHFSVCCKGSAL